jgi:hypothetical protein
MSEKRTELLHDIAIRTANRNIEEQLDVGIQLLEFYKDIEGKTADDLRKIKEQEKFIDLLNGTEYRDRLQNVITEQFAKLSDEHLALFHSELVYQDALSDLNITLIPALEEVQQELLYGVFEKPTLQ